MKITFLGTGTSQGVPVIGCDCDVCRSNDIKDKRLRTSVLIEVNGKVFVLDTGPDFREQMLREEVHNIDGIIYTHEHRDHIAGLDDVRPINYLKQKPIEIYGEERVLEALKQMIPYAFGENRYPGVPDINLNLITNQPFVIEGMEFTPIRVYHYKLPVFGFRVGDFTYITDANYIPEEEKEKIEGSKYIVVNALRKKKHISHFSLSESLEVISEFSPRKAYLIHMSHQMGFHESVNSKLPEYMSLAYDGLSFEV
ncbi:MAG: MBL fold metallo-hydrolase [Bacteroidales bacterium]|nr:MBL fold metallo-hydrolase [Bacteroidales bacterium]